MTPAQSFRLWLNGLGDEELATVLRHRPDVTLPPPPNLASLATRLLLHGSIALALQSCNAQQLKALEDLARAGGELKPVSPAEVNVDIAHQLADRALAFPTDQGWMVPPQVPSALPGDWTLQPAQFDPVALDNLSPQQRQILDTLTSSGGVGTTKDASLDADPQRPIPQLIAAGLVHRVDSRTVRLPRAVRSALRGVTPAQIPLEPSGRQLPPGSGPEEDADANHAAAAAALEVVRLMGRLLEHLGQHPVELLKDNTVGVRPLAALNKALDTEHAARLIALGLSARLLGRGEPSGGAEGNFLAPTELSTEWEDSDLSARAEFLVAAWFDSPWATWESTRVLDPETKHDALPRLRATVLDVYRHSSATLDTAQFWEDARFTRPLFATYTKAATIEACLEEAEWLGVLAKGRFATARPVPAQVEQFIVQADHTILVPGPLPAALHNTVRTLADVESGGVASVLRLSTASLRRGLDAGMTAAEITDFLRAHSLTPVPDSIVFLIEDAARRHGTLRGGTALSYLRSTDEAVLAQAVHASPHLRLIAPTVAIADVPLATVLEQLRAAGFSPAAEDADGATIQVVSTPALLPTPRAAVKRTQPTADVAGIVSALRGSAQSSAGTEEASASAESPRDLLLAAVRGRRSVRIAYATKNGTPRSATVTPLSVSGGQVDALSTAGATVRFPLERISAVELA